MSYIEFYNDALDHLDLIQEYRTWQVPDKQDTFSYCQYPFMLSIVAKRHILTKVNIIMYAYIYIEVIGLQFAPLLKWHVFIMVSDTYAYKGW